jgi:LmbE family N-acetylglucosaminyl deacetylase
MRFHKPTAEIFVPDGTSASKAITRTTHMAVVAHPDDIEVMALDGVLACFANPDKWFLGVVVTDGAGSARSGPYANYTDEHMKHIRRVEQCKAATIGEFGAQIFLDYPSKEVKDPENNNVMSDLRQILEAARPETLYIHNLADKHTTHIGVALKTISALRSLPMKSRPSQVYGCEVWRDLDWMQDEEKVVFNLDAHENMAAALIGVFDSQVAGGKRYDLAIMGRRRANATFFQSHSVDNAQMLNFAMDLTPLAQDDSLDIAEYVLGHIDRFRESVAKNLSKTQ